MHTPPERARSIAEQILEYTRLIATANAGKSDIWEAERQHLRDEGLKGGEVSLEIAKLKSAVEQFCTQETNPEKALKAEARREGADEYLHAITTAPRARARAHARQRPEMTPPAPESRTGLTSSVGSTQAAASNVTGPRPGDDAAAPQAAEMGANGTAEARQAAEGDAPSTHEDGGDHVNGQSLRAQHPNIDNPARSIGAAPGSSVTTLAPRVVSDPAVCEGAPIVKGTSIRTSMLRQYADDGWQAAAIIDEHPELTQLDVAAALQFEAMERAKEMGARSPGMRRTA